MAHGERSAGYERQKRFLIHRVILFHSGTPIPFKYRFMLVWSRKFKAEAISSVDLFYQRGYLRVIQLRDRNVLFVTKD